MSIPCNPSPSAVGSAYAYKRAQNKLAVICYFGEVGARCSLSYFCSHCSEQLLVLLLLLLLLVLLLLLLLLVLLLLLLLLVLLLLLLPLVLICF